MSQENFDKTISLTRRCMQILGVWPSFENNRNSFLKFFISLFLMLFFIVIPQTTNIYYVRNNLNDIIEILTYANLATITACCKLCNGWINRQGKNCLFVFFIWKIFYFFLFWFKQALRNLLIIIEEDWKVKESCKRYEMLKDQKFVKWIAKLYLVADVGSVLFYTIVKILSVDLSTRESFLLSKFLFNSQISPVYEITWLGQIVASITTAIVFGSYEGLYIILVFHLCSQLNILQSEVRSLVFESKKEGFAAALKPIVDSHFKLKK